MPPAFRILAVLLLVLAACGRAPAPRGDRTAAPVGSLRPGEIVPVDVDGYRQTLKSLRGKPLVVNFWASWCGPCATEMPRLVEASKRYEGRVRFLGVDVQDVGSEAAAFARKYNLTFPSLSDPSGDIQDAEGILGLPETHFYRADGELAFRHAGEIKTDQLETKLVEVLRVGASEKD